MADIVAGSSKRLGAVLFAAGGEFLGSRDLVKKLPALYNC